MSTSRTPAAAAAVLIALATAAQAGPADPIKECPPEHRLTQPRELTPPPDEGTLREVLSYVDITGVQGAKDAVLRIRRIKVEPGGYVPLHWHNERPSVDYIMEGELVEHGAFCAVPVVHRAGHSSHRFGDFLGHWWKNEGTVPVVLVSADVVPVSDANF
jgi:quercetin dioxygenase-like cupin family protein